jgi:predicted dienelactone hydrolase
VPLRLGVESGLSGARKLGKSSSPLESKQTRRPRKRSLLIAAIAAAVILAVVALYPATVKTFRPDGPYPVGVRIEHADLAGRTAPVMIWYPASPPSGSAPYLYMGNLTGAGVLDAPMDRQAAPYPLIVFSHGMGTCGCQSVYYTENLASFGYVVVAPDPADSAMCHIEGPPDVSVFQIGLAGLRSGGSLGGTLHVLLNERLRRINWGPSVRLAEAKAVIDRALEWNWDPNHPLAGMIDPDKIGFTGHSLGGYTTLRIGGIPSDSQDRDPRIKAILALAPAVASPAANPRPIPLMIISGDDTHFESPWQPIADLYQHAPPPKFAIRLKHTDHMTIADFTLTMSPLVKWGLPGFRSHYREKAQAYKDYSVAFFNLYLKHDSSRAAVLDAPSNPMVELWSTKQP